MIRLLISCCIFAVFVAVVIWFFLVKNAPFNNSRVGGDTFSLGDTIAYPFKTLPPGAVLPGESACARTVNKHSSHHESKPGNYQANHTNVFLKGYRIPQDDLDGYGSRVTGNFNGTTDEILQWGACKWGFDVDTLRAQAVQESDWDQSKLGDCGPQNQPTLSETNHCASVGILQVKDANIPSGYPHTYPYARISTAFNIDYSLAVRRQCFEGKLAWLNDPDVRKENAGVYTKGDEWGCMGFWFSGRWYDKEAKKYLYEHSELGDGIKYNYDHKTWLEY